MSAPLRIAVAGLGVVGTGTLTLLQQQADALAARCGRRLVVSAVSARDRTRDRGVDLSALRWFDDAASMAADPEVDLVVELIGGSEGKAKQVCEAALAAGKSVVTANKALLAEHGTALARQAEDKGVSLAYEAAVAGGIPIIKALREGLAGNQVKRVYGILNGTCNFILTQMRETGRDFGAILEEAQALGYAEADPSFDVDGIDAAHKLAILASLAFGSEVDFKAVHVEGIRHVSSLDIQFAAELGFRIKLLGIIEPAEAPAEGASRLYQRVHPCLVPLDSSIAPVEGVFNAVVVDADPVGQVMLEGRGAGAGPTASAVVADIVDIACGSRRPTFAIPAASLAPSAPSPLAERIGAYYIRLMVLDKPGVIADIAAALRDENVSLEAMLQRGRAPGEAVPVVMTTHEAPEAAMNRALSTIAALDSCLEPPRLLRIEPLAG